MADGGMFERGRAEARAFFGVAAGFCLLGAVSWVWPLLVGVVVALSAAATAGVWWWRSRRPSSVFPFGLAAPGASWVSVAGVQDWVDQDPLDAKSADQGSPAGDGEQGAGGNGVESPAAQRSQQGGRRRENAWSPMDAGRDAA